MYYVVKVKFNKWLNYKLVAIRATRESTLISSNNNCSENRLSLYISACVWVGLITFLSVFEMI